MLFPELKFLVSFGFFPKLVPYYYVSSSHLYPKVVIFAESADCTNWSLRYQIWPLKWVGPYHHIAQNLLPPVHITMYYYPFSCLLRNKDTSGISVRNVRNQGKHQNFFSSIFRCDNLDTLNSKINTLLAIL